jgi:molybdopterin biosynthesis enzyme
MARTPVAAHLARVTELLQPLRTRETKILPLLEALDFVTAAEVVSPIALCFARVEERRSPSAKRVSKPTSTLRG